ncbi:MULTISPECIES: carboxypeptidase-like regulatory domain-containing protein [unclassified Schlesneria]|uniref:carboxypeptidase-like regulatory domain-containing protein n=1 Tax=Schlesneria TaxID=656899 RepID=UPI002EDEC654
MKSCKGVSWSGLSLLLMGMVGCLGGASGPQEQLVPVEGTVTFDGKPYERLMVTFMPAAGNSARQGVGVTDAEGQFVMHNYQNKKGLPAGNYTVVFSLWLTPDGNVPPEDEPPANSRAVQAIPPSWNDVSKAGAPNKVIVGKEGKTDLVFNIPKSGKGGSASPKGPPANFMR